MTKKKHMKGNFTIPEIGYITADLVTGQDDLNTGDIWLQLAVFGEVIYG